MSVVSAANKVDSHQVHSQDGAHETILVQGRRLSVVGRLGEGAYSMVFLVQDPESRRRYALKRLAVQREEDLPNLIDEMERTQTLSNHPFICACYAYEVSRVEGRHYAVMLLQHGGTPLINILKDKAARGENLSQSDVLRMAFQIGSAVSYMHHQEGGPIAHRDIKAENIMEARDGAFRLVDFGSASTLAFEPRTANEFYRVQNEVASKTTLAYRAPEMCDVYRKHRIDQKVDVWAIGILLFYVMYFRFPFEETTLSILAGNVKFPDAPAYDAGLLEAVAQCLTQNPAERWTIDEMLSFLAGHFPVEEKHVKDMMDAMEDEESMDLVKSLKTPQQQQQQQHQEQHSFSKQKISCLVAPGEMGVQPRHPMCAGAEAAVPAWMKDGDGGAGGGGGGVGDDTSKQRQQQETASPSAKGGLLSKLKWQNSPSQQSPVSASPPSSAPAPAAPAPAAAPAAVAVEQPLQQPQPPQQQQTTAPTAKPSSGGGGFEDLFATPFGPGSGAPSSSSSQPMLPASSSSMPRVPNNSFAPGGGGTDASSYSQQQQQQPAKAFDLFAAPANPTGPAGPDMHFGSGATSSVAPKSKAEADPFAGLK